jgi:hypothetical protein
MFTRQQWATDLLMALGNMHPSDVAINFVVGWSVFETGTNSGAKYNLLNTTLKESGSTDFNSVGVQNYTSYSQGIAANVSTLVSSGGGLYYNGIVSALVNNSDNSLNPPNSVILNQLRTWSGGAANYGPGFVSSGASHRDDKFTYGDQMPTSSTNTSTLVNIPNPLQGLGDIFGWISDPARFAKLVLGMLLIVLGILAIIVDALGGLVSTIEKIAPAAATVATAAA